MKTRSTMRVVALAAAVSVAIGLSACAAPRTNPAQAQRPHPRASAPAIPEADPAPATVETPQANQGTQVKAMLPKTFGGKVSAEFDAAVGDLWINVNCRGTGEVKVAFEPLDSFSIRCTPDEVLTTRNQVSLANSHHLKLIVTAPETVEWAALAEQ